MLITFKTEAHAGVTMFGDVAKSMLKKMGHSGTIPGAILAEDVPEYLNRLTKAMSAGSSNVQATKNAWDDQSVSEQSRATPLIELLKAAAEQECNVRWDQAGTTEPGISI
ncbi:MAG: DUF1840 domain-containing protein [Thiotrichales bacterium]|nr:DUF1840 domain-containing protein [Thiotrichales bacterium]